MLTTERGAVLAAVAAVDSEGPDAALDDSEEPLRENDGSCIGIHFVKTRARVLDWVVGGIGLAFVKCFVL